MFNGYQVGEEEGDHLPLTLHGGINWIFPEIPGHFDGGFHTFEGEEKEGILIYYYYHPTSGTIGKWEGEECDTGPLHSKG